MSANVMRPAVSLGLVLTGCLGIMHWLAQSKVLWLGVGFPLVALGVGHSGLTLESALESLSRWLLARSVDVRIARQMIAEAPAEFRYRRGLEDR